MHKQYTLVSALVFAIVAIVQLLRVLNHWDVQIGPYAVPLAFSWVAMVLAAALSVWGFRSAR